MAKRSSVPSDPIAASPTMCLTSVMENRRSRTTPLAILALLVLLSGCACPITDPVKLRELKGEADSLMAGRPLGSPQGWAEVPKNRWPPVIASLEPQSVTVEHWGTEILVKPGMDGGWGYTVQRDQRALPMLAKCYSKVSDGVFWHGPC